MTGDGAAGAPLLLDQFLPEYDLSIVHADVLRAPPAECYEAALEMDLFRAPLARALLGLRAVPQRAAETVRGRAGTREAAAPPGTFRLKDMVDLGWILLGETPGAEMVLGQVSRPWKSVAAAAEDPATPGQFAGFSQPGYAKIVAGLRIDPYGAGSSIVTVETRVAIRDEKSRRRFRRYWALVGPFSSLIRRMALRQLARELRGPGSKEGNGMTMIRGSILIRRPVEEVFDFVADERNEPGYNPQLRSVEKTTPGPIGAGTRWHVVATSGRRSTPFELEVTEYTRPSRLGSVTRMAAADIDGALTFVPDAGGTRMSWTWKLRPKGMLKLAAPLFAAVGRRREQRTWSSLKAHLEGFP